MPHNSLTFQCAAPDPLPLFCAACEQRRHGRQSFRRPRWPAPTANRWGRSALGAAVAWGCLAAAAHAGPDACCVCNSFFSMCRSPCTACSPDCWPLVLVLCSWLRRSTCSRRCWSSPTAWPAASCPRRGSTPHRWAAWLRLCSIVQACSVLACRRFSLM